MPHPCHTHPPACPLSCIPPTTHPPAMHAPCHACPPRILRDAVNERTVRILLECILVRNNSGAVTDPTGPKGAIPVPEKWFKKRMTTGGRVGFKFLGLAPKKVNYCINLFSLVGYNQAEFLSCVRGMPTNSICLDRLNFSHLMMLFNIYIPFCPIFRNMPPAILLGISNFFVSRVSY